MPHIVYVLTNEAMQGVVKIGRTTTSVEQRIRELGEIWGLSRPLRREVS